MTTIQARTKILLVDDVYTPIPDTMLAAIPEAESESKVFVSDGADLMKLTKLLLQSDNFAELARMFAAARGAAIAEMLDGKQMPTRTTSDGTKPRGIRRGISLRRRSNSNLISSANVTPAKSSRQSSAGHKRQPSDQAALDKDAEGDDPMSATYEKGSHPFLRYFSLTITALRREQTLAALLVAEKPGVLDQLLRQLYHSKMDLAISNGELIVGKRCTGLSLMDIIETLTLTRKQVLEPILDVCNEQTSVRFHQLISSLADVARQSLLEFQDYIAVRTGVDLFSASCFCLLSWSTLSQHRTLS